MPSAFQIAFACIAMQKDLRTEIRRREAKVCAIGGKICFDLCHLLYTAIAEINNFRFSQRCTSLLRNRNEIIESAAGQRRSTAPF